MNERTAIVLIICLTVAAIAVVIIGEILDTMP